MLLPIANEYFGIVRENFFFTDFDQALEGDISIKNYDKMYYRYRYFQIPISSLPFAQKYLKSQKCFNLENVEHIIISLNE